MAVRETYYHDPRRMPDNVLAAAIRLGTLMVRKDPALRCRLELMLEEQDRRDRKAA